MRRAGRSTLRFDVPALSAVRNTALVLITLLGFAGAGFGMQRARGPRPSVLMIARTSEETRFSMFQMIMPRNSDATTAEVLRRASLLHAMKLGLGSHKAASMLYTGIVLPEWQADIEAGPAYDGTLLWPVREGYYVRGFGTGSGGYHLAVDIQGERGSSVLASAPGVVGYAGTTLRGYGNAIMIMHPGNFITLYAHNERNEVVPGQRVKRGQRIAALGSTGISRGPHVHFEFIHSGQNCDPLPLFRPMVRSRPNHIGPVEQTAWTQNEARPRAIHCDKRKHHPHSRWEEEEGEPLTPDAVNSEPIATAPSP
jgi:murein DD-endopeptidase MepM/ murein hydrolase activator NlpD